MVKTDFNKSHIFYFFLINSLVFVNVVPTGFRRIQLYFLFLLTNVIKHKSLSMRADEIISDF
jgi:hypothetical protein